MRRNMIFFIMFIVLIFLQFNQYAFAYSVGASTGTILMFDSQGARGAALSDGMTPIVNDVTALSANPATLSTLKMNSVSLSTRTLIEDNPIFSLLAGYAISEIGTIGINIIYFSSKEFDYLNSSFTSIDTLKTTEFLGGFSFSKTILPKLGLNIGASVKYISGKLKNSSDSEFNFDFGLLINRKILPWSKAHNDFSLGVAIQNIGTGLKYNETGSSIQPQNLRFGVSIIPLYNVLNEINIIADFNVPNDDRFTSNFAIEYRLIKYYNLSIRAGYKTPRDYGAFSIGIGASVNNFNLDYAVIPDSILGNQHIISLAFNF